VQVDLSVIVRPLSYVRTGVSSVTGDTRAVHVPGACCRSCCPFTHVCTDGADLSLLS